MNSFIRFGRGIFREGFALVCALALLLLLQGAEVFAKEQKASGGKNAIVLATFGSTVAQKSDPLALVRAEAQKRFPQSQVFVAYTSEHVRKTLAARGEDAKSLNQVLADLSAMGYERVAVQSLHVTPGKEFDTMAQVAALYPDLPKGAVQTAVGRPLVGSHEDAEYLASVLAENLPERRAKGDAVIFVGHGAESPTGSLAYPALQSFLQKRDPLLFVGTIEGPYTLKCLCKELAEAKVKTVWLVPLLTIVGDHAQNDIFGDEDNSWKMTFTAAGMKAHIVDRGLLALPGVATLFADHLAEVMEAFEAEHAMAGN